MAVQHVIMYDVAVSVQCLGQFLKICCIKTQACTYIQSDTEMELIPFLRSLRQTNFRVLDAPPMHHRTCCTLPAIDGTAKLLLSDRERYHKKLAQGCYTNYYVHQGQNHNFQTTSQASYQTDRPVYCCKVKYRNTTTKQPNYSKLISIAHNNISI